MQKLAAYFIPATDSVTPLQNGQQRGCITFDKYFKQVDKKNPIVSAQYKQHITKQGVYLMTPEGDYLAARWGGDTVQQTNILATIQEALEKWRTIARKKGLPEPRPMVNKYVTTWGKGKAAAERINHAKVGVTDWKPDGLLLMATTRDLPRKDPKSWKPGVYHTDRYSNIDMKIDETRNYSWLAFSKAEAKQLVPTGGGKQKVADPVVRRIARFMKDDVRGQCPGFQDQEIRKASMTAEVVEATGSTRTIRFQGRSITENIKRGFDAHLHGRAVYDTKQEKFLAFELVAVGMRKGMAGHNVRAGEPQAPMGVAFLIEGQKPVRALTGKGKEKK